MVALSSLSASAVISVRETCLHTPSLSAGTTLTQGNTYFYLGGIFTQGPWQGGGRVPITFRGRSGQYYRASPSSMLRTPSNSVRDAHGQVLGPG